MFSVCKQNHAATGVEYAIFCNFFNNYEKNLITAGANIIKVYSIRPYVDHNSKNRNIDLNPSTAKMKLECQAKYTLHGNIMAIKYVSLSGSQRDAILISFRDAKLSVVQHDPDTYGLKTLSLHYFEEEDIKGGWTGNYSTPIVRVDPDNRCAVMVVYGKKLVILPFRKDNSLDEIELADVKPMKKMPTQLVSKTPILASYIISLKELDEKIDNIIDIQFLHGYYEPTLLILYEPVRTFPGRIAVRSDTCTMVALSLNIQQRVHPIIWTVSSLPFDCLQLMCIQKPIGGCLVFSTNAVIYLNQSVPPYGVSLNSIADHSTSFPLKPQNGIKISLDAAQITFIANDKLVLSLKGGELYVLTLCVDSMRCVRNFHFNKAAASVLTSCICVCQDEFIFLGSRLGNSLLLRFREEDENTIITIDDTEVPKEKEKKRLEEEELEVYGTGKKTSVQLTKFIFEVCDSILNIGPIGFMTLGEQVSAITETEKDVEPKDNLEGMKLELVTSSGHGKNGAICVLVNAINPQIITSFELPGCIDMWTIFDEPSKRHRKPDTQHDFLILSEKSKTLVLQTGQEINEIENTGFTTNLPTIYVGNLGNNRFIVQVTTKNVRLLQSTRLLQNIPIDCGSSVAQVSSVDPYICIRIRNGQVITLALRENKGIPRLAINKNTISSVPAVICISAYKDTSGMFTTKTEDLLIPAAPLPAPTQYGAGGTPNLPTGAVKTEQHFKMEDEEDLLYGESGSAFKLNSLIDMALRSKNKNAEWWQRFYQPIKPTYWLLVARDNGNLEIYSMPDLKLLYLIQNIGNGHSTLMDAMEFVPATVVSQQNDNSNKTKEDIYSTQAANSAIPAQEIFVTSLGNQGNRPILIMRTYTDLMIYQIFSYSKGHIKIRFRKVYHDVIMFDSEKEPEPIFTDLNGDENTAKAVSTFRYFSNIAGLNGIIICGDNPRFVFMTPKCELRIHRLAANISMQSFAAFHNVNCPNGFLYFDISSELQICVLPSYLSYDSSWPVRKVPLRATPRHIEYHKANRVYCVVTQFEEESNKYFKFNGEDKELTEESKGERFIYLTASRFSVVLITPNTWEVIPDASIELDEWEHVTAFKIVSLAYEGTRSGLKEYLCVGTNFNYSEDITSRGKIMIYDVIEVVPEPGKPLTKFKLKQIYLKEQKGPVSAITHVLGFLVTAVGQKIYLWQLKDEDLIGVAFIDTNIYVHKMISVKSLILTADVYKSISILRFQEEYRTLSLVSRDFQQLNVLDVDFFVDNSTLGFLVSDADENLIIYMYQPEVRESLGGQKLIRKADYHLGQKVHAMIRVQCQKKAAIETKVQFHYKNRQIIIFGTLEGALGFCLPLPEKTYRRLFMLQNVLLTHNEHLCGLNPKSFRTVKSSRRLHCNPARCIVDGDLVFSFLELPFSDKLEVSQKIGTKIEEIYADLKEIELISIVF